MAALGTERVVGQNNRRMAPGYGARILQARLEATKDRPEVAELVGIHPDTLARYEREATAPSDEILIKLARVLRANARWLYSGEGDPRK